MKYVKTKKGEIKTTTNDGHHRDLAEKKDVASAGRYKVKAGAVTTYSKSKSYGIKPAAGDAAKIVAEKKKAKPKAGRPTR